MTPDWAQRGQIDLASVTHLAVAPGNAGDALVLAATPAGLSLSDDGGHSWRAGAPGLVGPFIRDLALSPAFANDGTIAAVMPGYLCHSNDRGRTWRRGEISDAVGSLTLLPNGDALIVADVDGTVWRAGTGASADDTLRPIGRLPAPATAIISDAGACALWAATLDGVYRSDDAGETWCVVPATTGLPVQALARFGPDRVAAGLETGGLLILGLDKDDPVRRALPGESIMAVVASADGARIVAGTARGVFTSRDGGASWQGPSSTGPVLSLASDQLGATIWAGLIGAGCLVSTDGGDNWRPVPVPAATLVSDLRGVADILVARTIEGLAAQSTDAGTNWQPAPLPPTATVQAVALGPDPARTLYATDHGLHTGDGRQIPRPERDLIRCLARSPNPDEAIIAAASASRMLISRDDLATWEERTPPLSPGEEIVDLAIGGDEIERTIAVATRDASGHGAVWMHAGLLGWRRVIAPAEPVPAVRLAVVDGPRGVFAAAGDSVYRPARVGPMLFSREIVAPQRPAPILHLAAHASGDGDDPVLAVATATSLHCSPDGGLTWLPIPGPSDLPVTALTLHPTARGLSLVVALLGGAIWVHPLESM